MDKKAVVHTFLKSQKHMVIATASNGIPEAALVGFCEGEDLNLVFGTSTTSRKFQNIQNNSRVALVFSDDKGITVQYEGIVSILLGKELAFYKKLYFEKSPGVKKYDSESNQIYLKIVPLWLRYTNKRKEPTEVFEIRI